METVVDSESDSEESEIFHFETKSVRIDDVTGLADQSGFET